MDIGSCYAYFGCCCLEDGALITDYIGYFQEFFAILWDFLLSPVPVLGFPWIALFGGPFVIYVLMSSLNHVLSYAGGSSISGLLKSESSKDKVPRTDYKH